MVTQLSFGTVNEKTWQSCIFRDFRCRFLARVAFWPVSILITGLPGSYSIFYCDFYLQSGQDFCRKCSRIFSGRILGRMDMDKSLCRKLSIDYKLAPLEPNVMELLKLCEKLSIRPAKCNARTSTICGSSVGLMPTFSTQSLLPRSTHVLSDSQPGSALRPTSTSAPSYLAG